MEVCQCVLKTAELQMLKKMKKILTVNTGQVMFSGEIYYYLNVALSTAFLTQKPLCIVGISRWQKSELSIFKAKREQM